MRRLLLCLTLASFSFAAEKAPEPAVIPEQEMLRKIYAETLTHGQAYDNLCVLVAQSPGRLSGSASLERAIGWGQKTLDALGLDRVFLQDVMVPHWERGPKESVTLTTASGTEPLTAVALGGSAPTPKEGTTAEVIEVKSLEELETLGREKLAGKIVFFNRPMDPAEPNPGSAYGRAGDQRNRGPVAAAKFGAIAALTRSLTHAHDDVPHTGATAHLPDGNIPAAALSTLASDKLSAALAASGAGVHVTIKINSQWLPDAPSHNVVGEIRGSEFPDQILLVGGHIDSWDIAPGAHDDGAGIVQSIEVLRTIKALGIKPRHTIRCVLFVNEENGTRGATQYAQAALAAGEKHLLAMESDNGGFQPNGFRFHSTQNNAHERAARWRALFEPYGISQFKSGSGGSDVQPLHFQGVTVGELTPDSQRYFDIHHTTIDTIDKVNPRELLLGAAALTSLIWLVDTQGL